MNSQKALNKKDIAIVGISGSYKGADGKEEFWKKLVNEEEFFRFYGHEELEASDLDPGILEMENFVPLDTSLESGEFFDYAFFRYSKDDTKMMDPQIRFMHQEVWKALEDAGYVPDHVKKKIGMYLATSDNWVWRAHAIANPETNVNPFYSGQISNKNFVNTLISYNLGLRGPSVFVDTACSSSLVSVHLGCRALWMRECDMAISGGIRLNSSIDHGYMHQEGMIFSKDGHCKPFDSDSSGTVAGNGSGVVILKRIEDAINDRDHIYAVIRSTAINNDGSDKIGFTAPSVLGQANCIKLAHKIANVSPDSISYIEAHGTATSLGDPVEVEALNKAFNFDKNHSCLIGSVKSNLGHLDAAAGVTGLIKVALSLKNKKIPPTLHFKKANPEIAFENGPFKVCHETHNWVSSDQHPLRAGVSSFGIGGTNAHAVLEEAPKLRENETKQRPFEVINFSAKTAASLNAYRARLVDYLESADKTNLTDLAYTLKVGRKRFDHTDYVVASSVTEAIEFLKQGAGTNKPLRTYKNVDNKVFMFPGQGSQYFGMTKTLFESEPVFRNHMEEGLEILSKLNAKDYKTILGINDEDGDPNLVNQTENTQPLLFLVEYALAQQLMYWGVKPNMMIGHSLGEFVAACISGVFSFKTALEIVVKRGELMNQLEAGKMISIFSPEDKIAEMLPEGVSVAAINTKDTCVVSGAFDKVDQLMARLKEKGIDYRELNTSHAFHSEMMNPILDEFESFLAEMELKDPTIPFVSNLSGKEILASEATSPKYWRDHLRGTVRFVEGVDFLMNQKYDTFLEIGPGRTLSGLINAHDKSQGKLVLNTVRHANKEVDDRKFLNVFMAELWSEGVAINWEAFYEVEQPRKIPAPTYCFDKYSFPVRVNPFENFSPGNNKSTNKLSIENWFYQTNWKKHPKTNVKLAPTEGNYLVLKRASAWIDIVVDAMKNSGFNLVEIEVDDSFSQLDQLNLLSSVKDKKFTKVVYACDPLELNHSFEDEFKAFLNICNEFFVNRNGIERVILLSQLDTNSLANNRASNYTNPLESLGQIAAQENPNTDFCSILIDSADESNLQSIIEDIKTDTLESIVSYHDRTRWVRTYDRVVTETPEKGNSQLIKKNGNYVIIGGLGTVGKSLTSHFVENYGATVNVIGRSSADQIAEKLESLSGFKEGKVNYFSGDVANMDALQSAITDVETTSGAIDGVILAAVNSAQSIYLTLDQITDQNIKDHFEPKINGVLNLKSALEGKTIDFVWVTSSLSAVLGGLTFGAYATSNKFIDAYIEANWLDHPNWMSVNLDGITDLGISEKKLPEVLERSLSLLGQPRLVASTSDLEQTILKQQEIILDNRKPAVESAERLTRPRSLGNYEAPSTAVEEELCSIWEDFFGIDKIGIDDDFFDLGGDSLKALTIGRQVLKQFEVEIGQREFFEKPTIRNLAEEIELINAVKDVTGDSEETEGLKEIKI